MNKLKKCLSVGLALAILLSMTGCGLFGGDEKGQSSVTKEDLVSSALDCLKDAESIDVSSLVFVEVSMENDGDDYSVSAEMVMDYQAHLPTNSLYLEADFEATEDWDGDEIESTLEIESYMVEEDGVIRSYAKKNGVWGKAEKDEFTLPHDVQKLLKAVNKKIDQFELDDDTSTVDGRTCYTVAGKLSNIYYLLEFYDLDKFFFDVDVEDIEAYVSIFVDKNSKELVGINLDLSAGLADLYEDVEEVEDLEIEQLTWNLIYNSIDEVEEITVPKSVKKAVEETDEPTVPDEPETTKPTEPTTTEPTTTEPEATEPSTPTNPSSNTLSSNWKDLDVEIDGVLYKFPYDYALLKQQGWTINMADYGYADGYILNKGGSVSSTLKLHNSKYGSEYRDFYIGCGFKNYDASAKDILECDLWSIVLDATYAFNLKDNYPKVVIAKNVTWGSTKAEIEAAFGSPKDVYESDSGYVVWTYDNDYNEQMRLTIYDSFGLAVIELKNYD